MPQQARPAALFGTLGHPRADRQAAAPVEIARAEFAAVHAAVQQAIELDLAGLKSQLDAACR